MPYKYIIFLTKYLFIIAIIATCCEGDPYKSIYGRWKIYKHTSVYRIGCLNQEQTDKMISYIMETEVVLCKNYIILDKIRYEKPIYEIREENIDNYLWDYYRVHDNKTTLGIKENTDKVKILKIYINNREKEENAEIDWPDREFCHLYFDGIVLYGGELLLCCESEFFYLKKIT